MRLTAHWLYVVLAWTVVGWSGLLAAPVPLDVAVKTGLVEVEVKGRGACSGDAVQVDVRRKVDREVQVIVEPGTVVKHTTDDAQSMVCHGVKYQREGNKYRRVDVMVLKDDKPHCFLLEAFCRDFHKPTPTAKNAYQLGSKDAPAASVIVKGKQSEADTKSIQVAVWLQKGVSDQELRQRFKATDVQIRTAHVLVELAAADEQQDEPDTAPITDQIVPMVQVQVEELLADLLERREDLGYLRGDVIAVTANETPIRVGPRTIATAKKGETYKVVAVNQNGVRVELAEGQGGLLRRGWIDEKAIRLAEAPRGEGRPLLRKLGELVSETELEVITAIERGQ